MARSHIHRISALGYLSVRVRFKILYLGGRKEAFWPGGIALT